MHGLRWVVQSPEAKDPHGFGTIRDEIERAIARVVDGLGLPEPLGDAIRYATLSGGKRLRPMLAYLGAESVGGDGAAAMPACVSVELVHAFSLVHDDLPALDDDDLRRGRPTLHRHAGEAMAILAGDAMLALAHEALGLVDPGMDDATHRTLSRMLSDGTRAMIVGQVHDTIGGGDGMPPAERVETIHRAKTGALIHAACVMGGACAGADDEKMSCLSDFGWAIGLQFQIVDDLLDIEGDPDRVGKTLKRDTAMRKLTYPSVHGVERAKAVRDELTDRARAALGRLGPETARLDALLDEIVARDL